MNMYLWTMNAASQQQNKQDQQDQDVIDGGFEVVNNVEKILNKKEQEHIINHHYNVANNQEKLKSYNSWLRRLAIITGIAAIYIDPVMLVGTVASLALRCNNLTIEQINDDKKDELNTIVTKNLIDSLKTLGMTYLPMVIAGGTGIVAPWTIAAGTVYLSLDKDQKITLFIADKAWNLTCFLAKGGFQLAKKGVGHMYNKIAKKDQVEVIVNLQQQEVNNNNNQLPQHIIQENVIVEQQNNQAQNRNIFQKCVQYLFPKK